MYSRHTYGSELGNKGWRDADIMEAGSWTNRKSGTRYVDKDPERVKKMHADLDIPTQGQIRGKATK